LLTKRTQLDLDREDPSEREKKAALLGVAAGGIATKKEEKKRKATFPETIGKRERAISGGQGKKKWKLVLPQGEKGEGPSNNLGLVASAGRRRKKQEKKGEGTLSYTCRGRQEKSGSGNDNLGSLNTGERKEKLPRPIFPFSAREEKKGRPLRRLLK